MNKSWVILALLLVCAFAIGFVGKIDLSAGPKASGERALLEAQAEDVLSQAEQQALDAAQERELRRQVAVETNDTTVKASRFKTYAVYGAISASAVIVLVFGSMLLVQFGVVANTRMLFAVIWSRSRGQAAATSVIHPGTMFITNDDSPGAGILVRPGQPPVAIEAPSAGTAAMARALGSAVQNTQGGTLLQTAQLLLHTLNRAQLTGSSTPPSDPSKKS